MPEAEISVATESEPDEDGEDSELDENGEPVLGKRGRKENGLVELTKKFISLLKEAPQ